MSAEITTLHAVKPITSTEAIRAEVIAMLEDALAEAKAGEIDELFMILKHPGGDEWSDRSTSTLNTTEWIGKLEVTKLSWSLKLLENDV
jgi:hypothetical protein